MGPLVVIYRLNCPAPREEIRLLADDTRRVKLIHGNVSVESCKLITVYTENGTVGTLALTKHNLPAASYLIIEVLPKGSTPDFRVQASVEAAGIASIIEATEPFLLVEKSLEVVANTPGVYSAAAEGPITITARLPTPIEDISNDLVKSINHLDEMSDLDRERFRLCSRWFLRGHETFNEIDRYLSWFIALEVYPAMGTSDVPGSVRNFIHKELYPDIEPEVIKEKLELGKLMGLRSDIVHHGITELGSGKVKDTSDLIKKLESIIRVVIRHLAEKEYDNSLDKWLRDNGR